MTGKPKYDVAISFLSQDESVGAALNSRLRATGLDVFFFPRTQEELAGKDGLEAMRTPFLTDSRLVVVLYRERWGKTPWTRVEEAAIKDGCLREGWHRLFFVQLDKSSRVPNWLPDTHVWFSYEDYGLEQAVGAIKMRVQENGGVFQPLTPLKRALLLQDEENFRTEKSLMNSSQGAEVVRGKVEELFNEICRHCTELNRELDLEIRFGFESQKVNSTEWPCVIAAHRVGLVVRWSQPSRYNLDNASLQVKEYSGRLLAPGDPFPVHPIPPWEIRQTSYVPEFSRAREYEWVESGKQSVFLSSNALAERSVNEFLELLDRENQGQVSHADPFGQVSYQFRDRRRR